MMYNLLILGSKGIGLLNLLGIGIPITLSDRRLMPIHNYRYQAFKPYNANLGLPFMPIVAVGVLILARCLKCGCG
jgi:hypothetical protein